MPAGTVLDGAVPARSHQRFSGAAHNGRWPFGGNEGVVVEQTSGVGAVELWLVRHGESTGNVAASVAAAAGQEVIDIDLRDADVPLTEVGRDQASAVGRWFAGAAQTERPDLVWSSPYLRARQT